MKRITLIAVLLIAVFAWQAPIAAQTDCSPAAIRAVISEANALLNTAQTVADEGDTATAVDLMSEASAMLSTLNQQCADSVTAAAPAVDLCAEYPDYCVPLGGGESSFFEQAVEAPELRTLTMASSAAPGVVRSVTEDGAFTIGDPAAPIQFLVFADFACSHCRNFHETTGHTLLREAVLSGQASYQVQLLAFVAGERSRNAAYAMFCAGEQGAAWEMQDALFRAYGELGSDTYQLDGLQTIAQSLGLDGEAVVNCISSGRYEGLLDSYRVNAANLGVTGTPSVLYRLDGQDWTLAPDRSLENLRQLVASAN